VFVADGPAFNVWRPFGGGLPHVPVYHLEYSAADGTLVAGTLGRGAWTLGVTSVPPVMTAALDGAATSPQPPQTSPAGSAAVQLRPGVVIDPGQQRVYVAAPQGGIDAVNTSTGAVVWRSTAAAKPVGVVDRRLVAQAAPANGETGLRVSVLDTATGRATMAPRTVPLPAGVRAPVADTAEARFALTLERGDASSNDARLSWKFERPTPARGVRPGTTDALSDPLADPPPLEAAAIPPQRSGAFRVNVTSGAIVPDDAPPVPPPLVETAPRAVPDRISGLPPTQVLSADGRHILASERIADDSTWDKYQWTIVERDTGRRIGQVRNHVAVAPFNVAGSTVMFESAPFARRTADRLVQEPLKIRAVDLTSGREIWNREVRDTTLRAPFPP
jgi:outer membrane protein assembly factor BamB